ncbi:MAG TPA: isoprenylcysteine carboxylmethyltransferase family protein [Mycobacterium sp.]|nr:isoprenylcysteine carboxylmethyltransferase family protein [Mycobacterium sp.]
MKLLLRTLASIVAGVAFFAVTLFLPAGTFHYWQAWLFTAIFMLATLIPSLYLAVVHPAALQRRMHAGPIAETRPAQRLVMWAIYVLVAALFVVSALDHRFGWSSVPVWLVIAGNVLVAAGLILAQAVVLQNNYAAATITVESDQQLVSTGLYGTVRHPMYVGALIMMIGTPLALDSYWGLAVMLPSLAVLAARILDEEKMLTGDLPGYAEYRQRVRYRLIPQVW